MPITFPRHVGQVPIFYGHRPSGAKSFFYGPYADESNEPLFPFGFGLSYTSFAFENLAVTPERVATDGSVQVTVDVVNSGACAGDEVVQLYTRTDGASVTRPVQELRGFQRVSLQPRERKTVVFDLAVGQLAYYDREMQLVVEPAMVQVMVGASSAHLPLTATFAITGARRIVGQRSHYFCAVDVKSA